jgi:hypothetical protein
MIAIIVPGKYESYRIAMRSWREIPQNNRIVKQ